VPLDEFREQYTPPVREALAHQLAGVQVAALREAMEHLSGRGKLFRPLLALAAYHAITAGNPSPYVPLAACFELIHIFTLIHDDLPALDDAQLRRGLPAVHAQYGEALALLAGDGLLALALDRLLHEESPLADSDRLAQLDAVANAVHATIEGEMLDLLAEHRELQVEDLARQHQLKSGSLLGACCRAAAIWAGADAQLGSSMQQLGVELGLAFQIRDDLLGVTSSEAETGKTLSSDEAHAKATYPRLLGVSGARAALGEAHRRVIEHLAEIALAEPRLLIEIADWLGREAAAPAGA